MDKKSLSERDTCSKRIVPAMLEVALDYQGPGFFQAPSSLAIESAAS